MADLGRNALGLGVCLALALAVGLPAKAETRAQSVKTEAEWIGYDAASGTVTVKVREPGKGARSLAKGKSADFRVKPGGPALTRTTVSIQGVRARLDEISRGETVNVYWRPDETDATIRSARRIDVILESARTYGAD